MVLGLAVCSAAWAQQELEYTSTFRTVLPLQGVRVDEFGNERGNWFQFEHGVLADNCGASICYDNFESDGLFPGSPIDGAYGQDCGVGSQRAFLGPNVCTNMIADDFVVSGDCDAQESGRIQMGWYWKAGGAGTTERCIIRVSVFNNFSTNCGLPAVSDFIDGFSIDFGPLKSSDDVGYYSADIALCRSKVLLTIPADGAGGLLIEYFTTDSQGIFVPATCAQPMLWSPDKPDNKGDQHPTHWSDLDRNSVFSPGSDCLDLSNGTCPGNFGAMYALYEKGIFGATPKLRLKCDGNCSGGNRIKARILNGVPGATVTLELDGAFFKNVTLNANGRALENICPVSLGTHTVQIPDYNLSRNTVCK